MATIEELSAALVKADAAGDTVGAKVLADHIRSMGSSAPAVGATSADIPGTTNPALPKSQHDIDRARELAAPERTFHDDSLRDKLYGPADAAMTLASSFGLGAIAPVVGFAKAALNPSDAKDPERYASEFAEAHQYQPRTGTGSQLAGLAGKALAPMTMLPTSELANIGRAVSSGSTALRGATGGLGARINAPINAADAVAATGGGRLRDLVTLRRAGTSDTLATGPQSAGAAASQHANMAAAAGASPEIVKIITDAGNDVHPLAAARHAEASSLPVPVSLSEGMATGNPELFSLEQNSRGRIPKFGTFLDDINGQLVENFDALRQRVSPDVAARGVDLGQMAVDAYKQMDAPVKADISAKYKALEDANGGEFPLSGADFVASADAALKKANRARFVPAEVQGIMGELREGGPMTFADFETYRTILAEQSRKAERASDGTASFAVGLVRNALESLPMTGETAALKPLADAARNAAKERFTRIAADPAYKAAISDGVEVGASSPLADSFIQKFAIKGTTAHAENMRANLGNDPLNAQIIAAGVIDHLKHVSGIDLRTNAGNVSQAGLNGAIGSIGKKGSIILGPETMDTINTLGNVSRYTMKQSRGAFVSNSGTAPALEAVVGAANTALDVKTLGATKILRKMMESRAAEQAAYRSMAPGAGINVANSPVLAKARKADLIRQAQANDAANAVAEAQAQSNLRARVDANRQQKAADIAGAQSIDEAVKAFSTPTD